jgi:hypothetical protein
MVSQSERLPIIIPIMGNVSLTKLPPPVYAFTARSVVF